MRIMLSRSRQENLNSVTHNSKLSNNISLHNMLSSKINIKVTKKPTLTSGLDCTHRVPGKGGVWGGVWECRLLAPPPPAPPAPGLPLRELRVPALLPPPPPPPLLRPPAPPLGRKGSRSSLLQPSDLKVNGNLTANRYNNWAEELYKYTVLEISWSDLIERNVFPIAA